MSRVGLQPIKLPATVQASVESGNVVVVKGTGGQLQQQVDPLITVNIADETITLARADNATKTRALHGLYRALIANMVTGVATGFERRLEIQGVGYRADKDGDRIKLRIGYSHEVFIEPIPGVELAVEGTQMIVIKGSDKQAVGQMAARIRAVRPVEPYKGKGIRYQGEKVRRKSGKSAKVGS